MRILERNYWQRDNEIPHTYWLERRSAQVAICRLYDGRLFFSLFG